MKFLENNGLTILFILIIFMCSTYYYLNDEVIERQKDNKPLETSPISFSGHIGDTPPPHDWINWMDVPLGHNGTFHVVNGRLIKMSD